ncbi:hypothetical protein [Rhodococcoides yunnanense]|uniref:hypothetical protein n=1 Tax=Rhodococcoides yunnanense TaxID=278209 RepID=UPI000A034D8C|nr:hypothetical protein [Rhodococcus yunnanensis]
MEEQLNELLADDGWLHPSAREFAEGTFDANVISAFYDGTEPPAPGASKALREAHLPLPTLEADDYRRVLMIGTTGAGKTTVIRQILGTDPDRDRFPSTSTAKTTVADTEIIVADGPYSAVVTFFSSEEVTDHLIECGVKAALSIRRGAAEHDVRSALLDHENQRFRFSYILGRKQKPKPPPAAKLDFDEFDEFELPSATTPKPTRFDAEPTHLDGVDLDESSRLIDSAISALKFLVARHGGAEESEYVEDEELDTALRDDDMFHSIIDSLLEDIEKRFTAQRIGVFEKNDVGWPQTWQFASADRSAFLQAVNRFTSNYAPLFGHLLTPLVDGIRVAGPFLPEWADGELPKLVLIDGEGLGHTARSSAALPTEVATTINEVDAVLLVDNAQQPMQAAPAAAIRSILTSGNVEKLVFCFTHFEEVQGDNLTSIRDRAHHVLASVDNVLSTIRQDFGPRAEQSVRDRLDNNRVLLSSIDQPLRKSTDNGKWSISQFQRLLAIIERSAERPDLGPAKPVYDKASLSAAIETGTRQFHHRWGGLLGTAEAEDVEKEHWSRIKALTKRFAEGIADQYDTLRPNAELRELLKDDIYKALERPGKWIGNPPESMEDQTVVIDQFSNAIAKRLEQPIRERLSEVPRSDWQISYAYSGNGSTGKRAQHISDSIFGKNVTVPEDLASTDPSTFLHVVIAAVEEAAAEVGVHLV